MINPTLAFILQLHLLPIQITHFFAIIGSVRSLQKYDFVMSYTLNTKKLIYIFILIFLYALVASQLHM